MPNVRGHNLTARMAELVNRRVPFVHATVVRAQVPTSAVPGDQAIVLADGTIEGFVGGYCATGSVRTAAMGVLHDGESVLLRVLPDGTADFPESPGAAVVVNPCLSGGALEIFLEPMLPSPVLHLVGETPIADALATLAETLGFSVQRDRADAKPDGVLAVIITTHGGDEPGAIRAALDAGVGFIGLVASRTRGQAVLDEVQLSDAERRRIHTPVGLPIGSRTAPEIALSIMAQLVQAVRLDGLQAAYSSPSVAPAQAVDPVCGMIVTITPDAPHLEVDGQDHWFCGPGCRDAYAKTG